MQLYIEISVEPICSKVVFLRRNALRMFPPGTHCRYTECNTSADLPHITETLPSTKSANARSCEMAPNSALLSGFVWMRSDAVSTNWPTVALKPERKALKGCVVC